MYKVLLDSTGKVSRFVNIVSKFDINAYLQSGRYIIDAKSIMGICNIDLSKPVELEFDIDGSGEESVDRYEKEIAEFIV